jgi:hypothetical protein
MVCQYVSIDLHRRRSVIVRQSSEGEVLEQVRINNDPVALACAIEKAGPDPQVVLKPRMVGIGRLICSKPAVPECTWLTR